MLLATPALKRSRAWSTSSFESCTPRLATRTSLRAESRLISAVFTSSAVAFRRSICCIRAQMVRADLDLQRLHQQQMELRNEIAVDVKTALINLDSARSEVRVANLGVQLSKEEVDQARDRFNAGVADNIEVIQAQDALARANDNQITALYRFNQARADLARSLGQMERVYSK